MGSRLSLDSWAILAWLQGEPAGEVVRDLIAWSQGDEGAGERIKKELGGDLERPRLFVNLVNLGEVFYLLGRRRGEREARETVEEIRYRRSRNPQGKRAHGYGHRYYLREGQ